MSSNEELVEQFVDITKDTEDRAKFFLEANNWTLEVSRPNNEIALLHAAVSIIAIVQF